MPTNQTENYQLSQWVKSDQVKMEDFNADNAKIDGVLGAHTSSLAALEEAAPHFGNCQIYVTSYKGDGVNDRNFGKDHPNSLTFPRKPAWVMIFTVDSQRQFNIFPEDIEYNYTSSIKVHIAWNGNTVTWYANDVFIQMNWFAYTYHVVAFCPMN